MTSQDAISVDKDTILGLVELNANVLGRLVKYPRLCYYSKAQGKIVSFVSKYYKIKSHITNGVCNQIIFYESPNVVNHVLYFHYPSTGKTPGPEEFEIICDFLNSMEITRIY